MSKKYKVFKELNAHTGKHTGDYIVEAANGALLPVYAVNLEDGAALGLWVICGMFESGSEVDGVIIKQGEQTGWLAQEGYEEGEQ